MNQTFSKSQAFTLIELMATLAIGSILAALAIPSYASSLLNNRLTSHANTFLTSLNLARNEAVKRDGSVSLCQSANGTTCSNNGDFSQGWIVFYDYNANGAIDSADCSNTGIPRTKDCIIRTSAALGNGFTLTGATPGGSFTYLSFSSKGLKPGAKASFTLSHSPDTADRKICVNISGRSRISKPANASNAAPDCP